ncbi:hypothetical protein AMAG_14199 [Allomyces macrogynus ATCC 38327]|uniref:Uncharacterized protein n=1 Tax=Allomyces macrogynus (strain ATCC 38327) TaxID=578462 RepID=A0A0L0T533_ALLM3|nr:hypothetical protein AMAG_14199 [Allomyces macrogynus ATCC 38327]|eukprot:KNE69644.1 hypothetical protein AMAG_14199 [Allomyces macrogynus ATCC 38327]
MICLPTPFDTTPTTTMPLPLPLIPSVPHVAADIKPVLSHPALVSLPSPARYAPVDLATPSFRRVDSARLAATIRGLSCATDEPAVVRKRNPTVKFPRIPTLPESPRVGTRAREVGEKEADEDQEELTHLAKCRRSVINLKDAGNQAARRCRHRCGLTRTWPPSMRLLRPIAKRRGSRLPATWTRSCSPCRRTRKMPRRSKSTCILDASRIGRIRAARTKSIVVVFAVLFVGYLSNRRCCVYLSVGNGLLYATFELPGWVECCRSRWISF